jgi:NADPH-dependent glutamate synthase beta subunit-like oxidoreductase/NAD-dependent dihydropyrimidine dehydrogenase PreA subunit
MYEAILMMGGLGLGIGICLAVASKVFYVYVDPKIEAVEAALPGANCGGCGLPGCSANAQAIVEGKSTPGSCVAGGSDIGEAIAKILGVSFEAREPDISRPGCTYGVEKADIKFSYDGLNDCRAAVLLSGGMKVCNIGCIGLGSCMKTCMFGAISMGKDGLPVVDKKLCTGCGACERACPKRIITLSSVTRRILHEYTTEDCTTPCQRNCPAGIDIREYIRQIELKDYHKAVQIIKERNPFPTVIGRICPRPCELNCRRKYVDEPVAINYLKRFVSDYEKENGGRILPYKAPPTGRKLAIIGGGAEGLSVAFFSARLGHEAVVFEASQHLGGLLRSAIASSRLPLEVLDWDIHGIMEMGITSKRGMLLGRDFTISSLLSEGYEAVFVATGGWDSRLARGATAPQGDEIPGCYLMIDFMKNIMAFESGSIGGFPYGKDVVIAGGGRLAVEAAVNCRKLGADSVTIMFRESKEDEQFKGIDFYSKELEGVNIIFRSGIVRILGEENRLNRIEYVDLDSLKTKIIPCSGLIMASARLPELIFRKTKTGAPEDSDQGKIFWEGVETYKQPAFRKETGLFADGDVLNDFSGAIKAIGAGRRAAASIHKMMYDMPVALSEKVLTFESMIQDVATVENVNKSLRQIMPLSSVKELSMGCESEKGFTEEMAGREASRCLKCGLICYEKSVLPQESVVRN